MRTTFVCQSCGYHSPKWFGRCPDCEEWNSLTEERIDKGEKRSLLHRPVGGSPQRISEVTSVENPRLSTGIREFDRVLGGGVVSGSLILVGGDPGIGKSTLLLQAAENVARRGGRVLYVSGEESPVQIKMRGDRVGASSENLYLLSETSLEEVLAAVQKMTPHILIIDSVQALFIQDILSAPGSVSQVREVASEVMTYTKRAALSTFLIGHVTKGGIIAGPRVLEHMVDTVLYFEGDGNSSFRILRAVKNRFGSVNEIGVFEMKEGGLEEVSNPSGLFLSERAQGVAGSAVVSSLEGTRPLLVEIQALVSSSTFGLPRRMANGVDQNRLSLLLAVLEKRAGIHLTGEDVYVNVVGGLTIEEPAVDLGVVAAVASSLRDNPIDSRTVVCGEVGLAGEVRAVPRGEIRLREAEKMGFTRFVLPEKNVKGLTGGLVEIIGVGHVREALEALMG